MHSPLRHSALTTGSFLSVPNMCLCAPVRTMCPCVCPQVAFINKLDRAGANPTRVVKDLRGKLRCVPDASSGLAG